MSTQKAKFELFARLQALGFTYDEAASLRRIEMTLHRWAEAECNGEIQREEKFDARGWDTGEGKPFRVYGQSHQNRYPIADREAGALKRGKAIVQARNDRVCHGHRHENFVHLYQQGDPRGCALYLVTNRELRKHCDRPSEGNLPIDQCYSRGLAVCC